MAANTSQGVASGTQVFRGRNASMITLNETNQLKASGGQVATVLVYGVGTAWVIDIYDHASANTNPRWQWVTADGKGQFRLDLPMANGIRVVTSGTTPGSVTVIWS